MNLRDLEYLVALDDHRHFGRAAAASYVSQPTLSTQLRKLEHELGVDLVERGGRTVLLTPAGADVVARARTVLAAVADVRGAADRYRDPLGGTLRLGAFPTLLPYLLPHVLPALREELPDLELVLVEARSEDLLAQVRGGALDVAILALPVEDDGLECEPLFREHFVLGAPDGHPLTRLGRPVEMADLDGVELLLLEEGHCLRQQALEVCALAGARERTDFRATSLETLRHMVSSGFGVTLLPRLAVSAPVPDYQGATLLPFADPAPFRDLVLVRRRTAVNPDLVAQVAAALRRLPSELVTPVP